MGVLKSDQGDVLHALQEHSAAAIDAGVDVLFPSRTLRVALLAELLRHQLKAPSPASSARRQLLDRLMWRFASTSSGAVTMIPRPGDSEKHLGAVRDLVNMLLNVASAEFVESGDNEFVEEDVFEEAQWLGATDTPEKSKIPPTIVGATARRRVRDLQRQGMSQNQATYQALLAGARNNTPGGDRRLPPMETASLEEAMRIMQLTPDSVRSMRRQHREHSESSWRSVE